MKHSVNEPATAPPVPDPLPADLPRPVDDGTARHLVGRTLPPLTFLATDVSQVRLDSACTGRWVLFIYPLTGNPGEDVPRGWNEIPGARGCSQEACGFRDHFEELSSHGIDRVLALSSDRHEYQVALVRRFRLPYQMLSDPKFELETAMDLPTFEAFGQRLYKRLTMVLTADTIEHVFYPVFPPDTHAAEVLYWLRQNSAGTGA